MISLQCCMTGTRTMTRCRRGPSLAFSGRLGSTVCVCSEKLQVQRCTKAADFRTNCLPSGVPVALEGPAKFFGQSCDGSELHMFSGRNGFEFNSPSGLDIVGVVLPRNIFLARLQDEEREYMTRAFQNPGLMVASSGEVCRLREMIFALLELFDSTGATTVAGHVAGMQRDLYELLVEAVLPCLPHGASSNPRRLQVVRDARDLVAGEQPEGTVTIEDLCRTLGVSRRTLQYSFNEVMGIAPAAYLRGIRLNGARRSLKAAASVTEAATAWGFWHFGRFAQEYRALFGERPSATLHRALGSMPV